MFDDFDGFCGCEPHEDDLQELSDREAWEDAQADMHEGDDQDVLHAEIRSSAENLAEINAMLSQNTQVSGHQHDAVLRSWTATFEDGFQVDLKVCNSDSGPWIEAVLLDQDGCEIQVESGEGLLEGDYNFSGYTLEVLVA